jgi:hypothetical protein
MNNIDIKNIPIFEPTEHLLSGKLGLYSAEPKQKLEKHKSKTILYAKKIKAFM